MSKISRRRFTSAAALALAAPAALSGLGRSALAETRLRLFWWGNPERDKRTFAVVDLYKQKRPEVTVDAEAIGWNDYWPKMATQAAGKNLPDVVQMDYRYMFEYARRGQLAAFDDNLGAEVDLSHFDQAFLDSGKVDGKLYAIPMGGNSTACYFDKTLMAEVGAPLPDKLWTWDDLAALGKTIKQAKPDGPAPIADKGHWEPALEIFLRQRGKALYDEAGEMAYAEEDLADFFGLWEAMRKEGLTPTADITAQDGGGLDVLPLTLQKAAIDFAHSNQLTALQKLNQHELALGMAPNQSDGKPGQYLKPAMQISVAATTGEMAEAMRLAAFLVTDVDAAAILRVERGVPGDLRVRESLAEAVDPLEKAMVDYLEVVSTHVSPLPPPPPKGAGEIEKAMLRFYPQLAFERVSVKDGAAQFYREAQSILRRA